MRGGLSTIDRDYGIFNDIHHDIGTHVVHHLFPQMPHYNLKEAVGALLLALLQNLCWAGSLWYLSVKWLGRFSSVLVSEVKCSRHFVNQGKRSSGALLE